MLWRCIKKQIGDSKELPNCVSINNILITDETRIPNQLNEFFVRSIKEMNESIPIVPYVLPSDSSALTIWSDFELTSQEEIHEIIKNIRTKSCINNVNKTVMMSSFSV